MTAMLSELPLAIFTTLAPVGAGAFIALAAVQCAGAFPAQEQGTRALKLMWVPLALVLAGFIASAFHLAAPGNMLHVAEGIGRSPLSNEVTAGGLFFVVAAAYWIAASSGKLGDAALKAFGIAAGALGVVFAVFTGLAYMMETIPTWNSPLNIVAMIGYALVGGAALGLIMLDGDDRPFGRVLSALALIGCVLAFIGVIGVAAFASGLTSPIAAGSDLVAGALPMIVLGLALIAAASVLSMIAASRPGKPSAAYLSLLLAVIGVLLARFAFYALQMSVGISLM
ncbi:DmsC/YnfH family molybdoenzyme membrane anchor subunit [Gordonibacter sp. Marseille-P4307]|uniref:dimethyl sulfoxide reductase anchor subunit family protein n=1 Tax=Gordonibacter sp. Marseille-P4307 TaxID=2161815 RepID=UPI000F53D4BA|nr:DmsC/YnfH family molybdoenzyme membrane anchor subunit [Gordonibacter sp. Marseille-P4307]